MVLGSWYLVVLHCNWTVLYIYTSSISHMQLVVTMQTGLFNVTRCFKYNFFEYLKKKIKSRILQNMKSKLGPLIYYWNGIHVLGINVDGFVQGFFDKRTFKYYVIKYVIVTYYLVKLLLFEQKRVASIVLDGKSEY